MKRAFSVIAVAALSAGLLSAPAAAIGDPILTGCNDTALPRNDDGSSQALSLPFDVAFGGRTFDTAWVNNNGNVTFDGPMSTYTPFGLAGTSRAIIAPFFADVDTRATGSNEVTYSWGTTTYSGRPALCVNYLDVGYYDSKADKTNALQLVLVDRGDVRPGSFDIMFNYRRISWETGDASGGVDGYGGSSAAIGFSNGAGQYYEVPGSLQPGSFLDSGPEAMVSRSNVGRPGRWLWPMRAGLSPTNYVALGDSFQSGEGAYEYEEGTDVATNRCHRSAKAYSRLITESGGDYSLGVALTTKFVACSGARMAQMTEQFDAEKGNEPAQFDALGDDTALVTVGISGNDLEFAKTITACVEQGIGTTIISPIFNLASCQRWKGGEVEDRLTSLRQGDLHAKLSAVYKGIREKAKRAKVIVVTYPQFFRPPNWVESRGNCAGVRGSDQTWINEGIKRADELIANLARSYGFAVADMSTVLGDDHGLCSGDAGMNGLIAFDGDDNHKPGRGTYHPNQLGHRLFAQEVRTTYSAMIGQSGSYAAADSAVTADGGQSGVDGDLLRETIPVAQGGSVVRRVVVDGTDLAVNTQWQDGTVSLHLTSPSGVTVDAANPGDGDVQTGETYQRIFVPQAERGQWTVEVVGDAVPGATQDVSLSAASTPIPNRAPIVVAHARIDAAGDVVLDASGSADPDGDAVSFGWDFGDGTSAAGQVVSHRYSPGTYVPVLVVTDARGNSSVQQVNVIVNQPEEGMVTLVAVDADGNPISPAELPSPPVGTKGSPAAKPTSAISLQVVRPASKKDRRGLTPSSKVTLRARVTPDSAAGSVTFADSGHTLGSARIRSGTATSVTVGLYGGRQRLTAHYTGDDTVAGSTSAPVAVTVTDRTPPIVAKPKIHRQASKTAVLVRARDSGGVRSITIRWRAAGKGAWRSESLPGTTRTWTIPNTVAKAEYCVRVRARNFAGTDSRWQVACHRAR